MFAFPIQKIQTDHGAEFPFTFVLALERRGIRHGYIRPRCPEQNGKVERSHRIDHDEFWSRRGFDTFETAATQLRAWERVYNEDRSILHGAPRPGEGSCPRDLSPGRSLGPGERL